MTNSQVVFGLIISLVSVLATFFVTTIAQKSSLKSIVLETIQLEKSYILSEITTRMAEHECTCVARRRVDKMERAMVFLVTHLGGNPKELGLLD